MTLAQFRKLWASKLNEAQYAVAKQVLQGFSHMAIARRMRASEHKVAQWVKEAEAVMGKPLPRAKAGRKKQPPKTQYLWSDQALERVIKREAQREASNEVGAADGDVVCSYCRMHFHDVARGDECQALEQDRARSCIGSALGAAG
jgi:hypothetical protein